MHFINVTTMKLEEFASEANMDYAILSHRWGDEEVSFTDMQSLDVARTKQGFNKISKCCAEAARGGCKYAWVDTCCIDKRSSADLSEAINSMFRWYKNSKVCFAYLSDVGTHGPEILNQFKSSQWFERGWTLQELIAPSQVLFYNSAWLRFGSRHSLVDQVVEASGISAKVLLGHQSIFDFSIAQRMNWASRRKTTRIEDQAYSLMGIFNVNMAMLYGEGDKAFLRLQEEIIKHSDDDSIFAWTGVTVYGSGLLAPRLDCFASSSNVTIPNSDVRLVERQPWVMTNRGLSVDLDLTPWSSDTYLACLECHPPDANPRNSTVGIFLRRIQGRQFYRVAADDGDLLIDGSHVLNERDIRQVSAFVKQDELSPQLQTRQIVENVPLYGVKLLPITDVDLKLAVTTKANWNVDTGIAELSPGHRGSILAIDLLPYQKSLERIRIDLDFDFRPRITLGQRFNRAHGTFLEDKPAIVRGIWDAHFTESLSWSTKCFASNPERTWGQFEGAIEDAFGPHMFLYQVPAYQTTNLIDVMHRTSGGSSHILVAELDIRLVPFKGRRLWVVGIKLFPPEGASLEESEKALRKYENFAKP